MSEYVPMGEDADDGLEADVPAAPAANATSSTDNGTDVPMTPIMAAKVSELEELVAERTLDLQRLQAEYVNYKRRVDRDRAVSRQAGIEAVVTDLLPVIDSIEGAREHDELTGGFRLAADELEKIAGKYGLVTFGEVGDPFDPAIHDALMRLPMEGVTVETCSAVMQKGVRLGDRIIRPARVAVADPDHTPDH